MKLDLISGGRPKSLSVVKREKCLKWSSVISEEGRGKGLVNDSMLVIINQFVYTRTSKRKADRLDIEIHKILISIMLS